VRVLGRASRRAQGHAGEKTDNQRGDIGHARSPAVPMAGGGRHRIGHTIVTR
jgi:hypothetical protein